MASVAVVAVTKRFGVHIALDAVDVAAGAEEFVALLGPSGCGKTTLLRLIAGFEVPDKGEIMLGDAVVARRGSALPPEARNIGMVFQSYALWPHMSVADNVGFALRARKVPAAERRRRVGEALELVGLSEHALRKPEALSGGQRQRVALARCFAMRPQVVLLDEPLANLDVHLREAMQEELRRFHRELGATFVYVTHDQAEAMALADRVVVMNAGRIEQIAKPRKLYAEPATAMVAAFVGRGAVARVCVLDAGAGGTLVELFGTRFFARGRGVAGERRNVCLRPPDLGLAATSEGIPGEVVSVSYQGADNLVTVRCGTPEAPLLLRLEHRGPATPGERVGVVVRDAWLIPERG